MTIMSILKKTIRITSFGMLLFFSSIHLATPETSFFSKIPYKKELLTTFGLLVHEILQPAGSPLTEVRVHRPSIITDKPFPTLNQAVTAAITRRGIRTHLADMQDTQICVCDNTVYLNPTWYQTLLTINTSKKNLAQDALNAAMGHEIGHIENLDRLRKPVANIAVIVAVPLLLHIYSQLSNTAFHAVSNRLSPNGTAHWCVSTARNVHHAIVKSPLTQIAITLIIQRWWSRYFERQADRRSVELAGKDSNPDNFFMSDVIETVVLYKQSNVHIGKPNHLQRIWSALFATHDPIVSRIAYVRKVHSELFDPS
jgi:hypothetical protein